jgi:hypothetical protein
MGAGPELVVATDRQIYQFASDTVAPTIVFSVANHGSAAASFYSLSCELPLGVVVQQRVGLGWRDVWGVWACAGGVSEQFILDAGRSYTDTVRPPLGPGFYRLRLAYQVLYVEVPSSSSSAYSAAFEFR